MQKTALPSANSVTIARSEFSHLAEGWLLDCEIRQHSKGTLEKRRFILQKFAWFMDARKHEVITTYVIRQFLAHVTTGHTEPGGRWGNSRSMRPVKPSYVQMFHSEMRALFNWILTEEAIEISPMAKLKAPIDRADQVQPFTRDQVVKLFLAARKSSNSRRDIAICRLLYDTGLRASELAGIRRSDVDLTNRIVTVDGKGNKRRSVSFGAKSAKSIWHYLTEDARPLRPEDDAEKNEPVFLSDRGRDADGRLTRSGVLQLIRRLGREAGIEMARCCPHTFRHTFAIEYLRNGGDQFTLMTILGHTDLKMTARYVKIAQADVARQHRRCSPGDRI